jgi:hypothetical protein
MIQKIQKCRKGVCTKHRKEGYTILLKMKNIKAIRTIESKTGFDTVLNLKSKDYAKIIN